MRILIEKPVLKKVIRNGLADGIRQTAIRLLKENCGLELISRVTGLSLEDVRKLKRNLDY